MLSQQAIITIEARRAAAIRIESPLATIGQAISAAFGELYAYLGAQRISGGPPFCLYREFAPDRVVCDAGTAVEVAPPETDRVKVIELPGGRVARALHTGPYEQIATSYAELNRWIEAQGERPGPTMWEVYLTDPETEPDPDRWQTEIYQLLA